MSNEFNFEAFETRNISEEQAKEISEKKELRRAKKKKENKIITAITIIIAVLFVAVAGVTCYFYTSAEHNPDKLVKSYVSSLEKGEWEKAYSMISFDEDTLISEEDFLKYCAENPEMMTIAEGKIISFEIEKDKISENKDLIYYSVNYVTEDKSNGTAYLTVAKTRDIVGRLSSFAVIPSQRCFCSLTVTTPSRTELYIDGIKLENPTEENGRLVYEVKNLLCKSTELVAKNEYCDEYKNTIQLSTGINRAGISLPMSEDCYNNLGELTKEYIGALYNMVMNKQEDYSSLPFYKPYMESKEFEQDINQLKEDVFLGNYTVSDFKLTEADAKKSFEDNKITFTAYGKNEIEIKYNFKYSFTYTYNDEAGNPVSSTKTDSGYFGIKYILDGSWYICDISSKAWF